MQSKAYVAQICNTEILLQSDDSICRGGGGGVDDAVGVAILSLKMRVPQVGGAPRTPVNVDTAKVNDKNQ